MSNLRRQVARHDSESFVGRKAELELLVGVLERTVPQQVVHVSGPGGIGKSTLLRQMARHAESLGYSVVWVDGRELGLDAGALAAAWGRGGADSPRLLVLDSYELVSSLDTHLRDTLIPELPDTTLVVFGSRLPPSAAWFEGGWSALFTALALAPLDANDAEELARRHGACEDRIPELIRRSHGSPLAVVVGADARADGSLAFLAGRLLGREDDPDHHGALSVAALARVTTPELLAAVLPGRDPLASYRWLASRSFAEPLAEGVALHPLVGEALRDTLRERDPIGEAVLRRRIADHLYQRARSGNFAMSADLQHLVVDRNVRWGYSADVGSRYRIDVVRPGDAELIGSLLAAVGYEEWWRAGEPFFHDRPEFTRVARDANGHIGGYCVSMSVAAAPSIAEHDLVLGPWLRYLRDELRTSSAVIWREAVDLTGTMGEVTALLGTAGVLGSGVANPRYIMLPISLDIPAALAFSESLGGRPLPELAVEAHGMCLECHLVDFGPSGILGFQRDWIYRETGALPPSGGAPGDPALLLAGLRNGKELVDGPTWLGQTRAERVARLRELVADVVRGWGDDGDERLAGEIVTAAYLESDLPHEGIARRLHLSRSAYFRRFRAANDRVADELARHHGWGV